MDKYRDVASVLLLVLFNILCILPACFASNAIATISPSQALRVEQALISPGQIFELGFFSPGNSSRLYIGIWYKTDPDHRIVWVSNRRKAPLAGDSASKLIISSDGNLMLIMESKTLSGQQMLLSSLIAQLQCLVLTDDGDFILKDKSFRGNSMGKLF